MQWAKLYDPDSPSRKLITDVMNTSYLVNVVHNNFHDPDAIFKPFFKAGAEFATRNQSVSVNGHQ
jgi:methylenetetrahydrofolate reductase (NADPH)